MDKSDIHLIVKNALGHDDYETLRAVLSGVENPNEIMSGLTALSLSILIKNNQIADQLLTRGADPNLRNEDGSTALTLASDGDSLRKLVAHGASVKYEVPFDAGTSVHLTCSRDDPKSLRLLMREAQGASALELRDEFRRTPLDIASESGNLEMVRILIEHGAPINSFDEATGSPTALQIAVEESHLEVVKELLAAGADPNLTSGMNPLPEHIAANEPELLKLLRNS